MRRLALAFGFTLFAGAVSAQEAIDPIDFGLTAISLINQRVTVSNCHVAQMTIDAGRCLIKSQGNTVGDYWFETAGMALENVKRLVENCANLKANPEHCLVNTTGVVTEKYNNIRLVETTVEFLNTD